ncbi:hypothetical protein BDW74DRAFT_174463 [Aspergillus multicolor]|uniref:uncharacterized protein n=1 Tax=Aspergillus multicolor TaxID=41759 RepID=UPI003CCDEA58
MPWIQTSTSDILSHELGGPEKYPYSAHLEHQTGGGVESAALRFEVPALAPTPSGLDQVLYQIPTPDNVNAWAAQAFFVERTKQLDEILTNYPLRGPPTLIYLEKSAQVLLLISHWRVDALGCYLQKIPKCLEDAAGCPTHPTPDIEATAQTITSNFQQKAMRTMGVLYQGTSATPPGSPGRQGAVWDEASSAALINACRTRSITVTVAVYATLAATLFALSNNKDSEEFATLMSVHTRPYISTSASQGSNSAAQAMRPYVSTITPTVSRSASFALSTRALTHYFKNWPSESFSLALREIYRRASRALLNLPPRPPGATAPPPPSGTTLSSLGVVNKYLSTPVVRKFEFGVSMLTRQMLLYAYSFRGQFYLWIDYNSAYYSAETVKNALGRIEGVLRAELDIGAE